MNRFLVLFFAVLIFISCQEEEFPDADKFEIDKSYFPTKINQFRLYLVDSVQYDFNPATQSIVADTSTYYIREHVIDTVRTQDGKLWTEIEVSRRDGTSGKFTVVDYYRERVEELRALRYENGLTFVKLVFPITELKQWNGNQFFETPHIVYVKEELLEDYKNFNYTYESTMESLMVGEKLLDSVVHVVQKEDNSGGVNLFKDVAEEYYAKDIGLVKKYRALLQSTCATQGNVTQFCQNNPIEYHADRGYILNMQLVEYGGIPRN